MHPSMNLSQVHRSMFLQHRLFAFEYGSFPCLSLKSSCT